MRIKDFAFLESVVDPGVRFYPRIRVTQKLGLNAFLESVSELCVGVKSESHTT